MQHCRVRRWSLWGKSSLCLRTDNASDLPRQAIFSRWHNQRPDLLEPTEIVLANPLLDAEHMGETRTIRAGFDIGGIRTTKDLWKWWTPQVRAAAAAAEVGADAAKL